MSLFKLRAAKHSAGSLCIPHTHTTVDTYAYSHTRTFCLRVADWCLPPGSLFAVPSCNTCSHHFSLSRLTPCTYTFHCTREGMRNCKRCICIMELMVDFYFFLFISLSHRKLENWGEGPGIKGRIGRVQPTGLTCPSSLWMPVSPPPTPHVNSFHRFIRPGDQG